MTVPTPTPRCLLAATDFSAPASLALQRAALLAREHGAALDLAHVLNRRWLDELRQWLRADTPWAAPLHDAAQAQLHAAADTLWQPSVGEGDAPQRILEVAAAQRCDLIAIGKHGRQAAEELLLGSVTRHVLEEAEGDVLVSTAHGEPA